MTHEQQQQVSAIMEGFRDNPSNANKYRYRLFAYIDELLTDPTYLEKDEDD